VHIAILCSLLLSCNLFDTRDPDNPVTDNQTLPTAYLPKDVIDNFQKAFEDKNIKGYESLFADTTTHGRVFLFEPNQSAASRYAAVFSSWDNVAESKYFLNIVNAVGSASPMTFHITASNWNQIHPDSAQYTLDYDLSVPHNRNDLKTQKFVGRSEIYMSPDKKTHTIWRIYRWVDFETKKDSSWSELKGQFAK